MNQFQRAEKMLKSIEDNRRELKTKVRSDRENDNQLKQKQKSLQQLEENLEQMEDPATLRERMNQVNAEVIRLKEKRDEIQGPLEETRTHRQELIHQRQSVVAVLRKLTNTMEQQYQHIKRIDEVRLTEKNDWIRISSRHFNGFNQTNLGLSMLFMAPF